MTFLAPLWLIALLPWAAFAVWTWMGRRRRRWVPFLPLWDAPQELRRPKRGVEPPPVGLVLALLAMGLGILAMARPVGRGADRGAVTIIVDRGASMSAMMNGRARFAELANSAGPEMLQRLGAGAVELVDVVEGGVTKSNRADWAGIVAGWKRTALDTSQALAATVQQHVGRHEAVIVLSDWEIGISDEQLVQVRPRGVVRNVGIVTLAERPGEVMVTLCATEAGARGLSVRAGGRVVEKRVELQAGVDQNVFVELEAAGDTIETALDGRDDFDGDDRAWIVRQRSAPIVEARVALPDELRRMIEIYGKHRPGDAASSVRVAMARAGELKADEAGVEMAALESAMETLRGPVLTASHQVVTGVDFAGVSRGAAAAVAATRGPAGEGWTKVVWIGEQTLVAVREGNARQVWVGFESREFARTPGFVVFWSNVLDWVGGRGAGGFAGSPLRLMRDARRVMPERLSDDDVDAAAWPGVFETAGGRKVAMNAGQVAFNGAGGMSGEWSRLRPAGARAAPLERWLALGALSCLAGAAGVWEKRRRQRLQSPQAPVDGPKQAIA